MFGKFAENAISEKQLYEDCNCLPLSYAGGHLGIEVTEKILGAAMVNLPGVFVGTGRVLSAVD
jgi:hypothetical protein